uniref:NADH-ubiquinone oxidoreductase chain 2 n=1 Tax=Allorhynchium sp. GX TaxID=2742723 RepID=A0A6M9AWW7_9HYME|nr:NADH dehydrogenase subunit 2 [Allorhynchium sp. GX]QKK69195.1 NADH dehydrogenase subunit 2 [Allorhynchium sp. GX]
MKKILKLNLNSSFNNKFMNNISILLMILSNILALTSSNLNFLWILLEINTMIFMFMLIQSNSSTSMIPSFFLIQSTSSIILIWSLNFNYNLENFFLWLYLALALKIGLFPFSWLPPFIYKNMNWLLIFLFSTSNKFISFLIIMNLPLKMNLFFMSMCFITIIFSTIKSIFHNNFKILMAFSSINNSCWMIFSIIIDLKIFLIFFIFYSFFLFIICLMLNYLNSFNNISLKLLSSNMNLNYFFFFFSFSLMNLSMIPPMTSFSIKYFSTLYLIKENQLFFIWTLLTFSTLSIILYLNILIKFLNLSLIKFNYMINFSPLTHFSLIFLPSFLILSFLLMIFSP